MASAIEKRCLVEVLREKYRRAGRRTKGEILEMSWCPNFSGPQARHTAAGPAGGRAAAKTRQSRKALQVR